LFRSLPSLAEFDDFGPSNVKDASLGVTPDRVYFDHGLAGSNRERQGLREALAACRDGDTLVVTKLDRLARPLPDARAIADGATSL
jgi:DNA invertase Pin-like site-specific DNA recombinase